MKAYAYSLTSVAILFAATTANAGGYIAPVVETVAPVEVIEAPLTWKGAYAGATVGYAFGGDDEVGYSRNDNIFYNSDTLELSGVNAGIRAGYRTQFTGRSRDWVIGAELGYEGGSIEDSFTDGAFEAESSINNVIALRVKTGVLNNAKDTLFYGILGVAQADFDYRIEGVDGATGFGIETMGETMTGYIVGLGVERKLNERLSVTGEWEYANFGKETLEADGFPYSTEMTPDFHNIKIGLNYQF
ncbi:porin family protein [Paracoccus aurantiacus]|uniref:Porin family protein n=1 Tax=Paracoccus aurantiacus TaxID=2599412 RepID=A0A5C6S5I2_9RHOB|nr:outer membrane beta-barrel protein [Paracoccus aurantiacus]TXB69695.1 porin family protein [Paracoccus aurantiacus]